MTHHLIDVVIVNFVPSASNRRLQLIFSLPN